VIPLFAGVEFQIRFQPFQLDARMPTNVEKATYFQKMFNAKDTILSNTDKERERKRKLRDLQDKWAAHGLKLTSPAGIHGGEWGNTFNSQRLIWFARQQGCEDAMIERVYEANHEHNKSLGDENVLLEAAEAAGVVGAREMLASSHGVAEVVAKIEKYVRLGITAVPSIILDERWLISTGAPEKEFLAGAFHELISTGKLPWPPLPTIDDEATAPRKLT